MRWPPAAHNWPMAEVSQQVLCRPHRWHVQMAGSGPTLLLIHGAGGATQSFRNLFPLLAQDHKVVAIDLPGQGFTQCGARHRCGLQDMASDILALLRQEGIAPDLMIGHSAGAAIALELCDLGLRPDRGVMAINAALSNFKGVAGWLFPALAKALSVTPFAAEVFCATVTTTGIRNLIKGTGSHLDDEGVALYRRLARDPRHVDGTLAMMAQWDLAPLLARLSNIETHVHFVVGDRDQAVVPDTSLKAADSLPHATLTRLTGLGHLAHEEDAAAFADLIQKQMGRQSSH